MRRLPALHLVIVACGAGMMLGGLLPGWSFAQEVMKFERVPAESVTELDRRSSQRTTTTRVTPAAPATPAAPEDPEPPSPPRVGGKSGDIVRFGGDIHVDKDETVVGDVVALRGDVDVEGHVEGNIAAMAGDVYLRPGARVDGDVMCLGGRIHEESGSYIGGQRVTALGEGRRGRQRLRERIREKLREGHDLDLDSDHKDVVGSIVWLLLGLLAAWLFTKFAPVRTTVALETVKREPGWCALVGFLTALLLVPSLVALCLVVALLCITIIGIPFALALLIAYFGVLFLLCWWGFVVGGVVVGERVVPRLAPTVPNAQGESQSRSLTRTALWGMAALTGLGVLSDLLDVIPFFGWASGLVGAVGFIAMIILTLTGVGALLRSKIGQGPSGQWWPLRPATPQPVPPGPAASQGTGTWVPSPPPVSSPPAGPPPASPPAASEG